jgi:hypothetical protein
MYPYRIVIIEECYDAREALACLAERAGPDVDVHAEGLEGDPDGGSDWVELTREALVNCAQQEAQYEQEFGHLRPA